MKRAWLVIPIALGFAHHDWASPTGRATILAHRGLAQEYDREGLTGDTCTAARMRPPRHDHLENTLPSIRAAFELGADIVEVDVHPTTDGEFAVFHDWTLDCRTDGHGVTREHTMAELRGLDVGHGYTADGGRTFPFRGRAVGLMPTLREVLATFPDRRFLVNIKSNDPAEGAALLAYLGPGRTDRVAIGGAEAPVSALAAAGYRTLTKQGVKACLGGYLWQGVVGHVPAACRDRIVYLPINAAPLMWGWPDQLHARMAAAGAEVFVVGPWRGGFTDGLDDPALLPPGYTGGVSTDQIDRIAPALGRPAKPTE